MKAEELLSILIQMSRSDDYFDQFELTYILKVGQHIGVENEVVESIIKGGGDTSFQAPAKEQDRMSILYYLLFLMKIDTIISDQEKELVHHYGFKLGFSKPMLDEFIDVVEAHKFRKIPPDTLVEIIKKYQN